MRTDIWIRVSGRKRYGKWAAGMVHAFKTKPSTQANELAIKLDLTIPDSFFELPELKAIVELPESGSRSEIHATVERNIADQLTKALGVRVHLSQEVSAQ